jgi:D-aminoacyl-tRNA deacylase
MKALIQRVTQAQVIVETRSVGAIEDGLLVLIGMEQDDSTEHAKKMVHKLLNYRVFSDDEGKMNLSLKDINGGLLLVPQFTLAADTRKGMRPSFSKALEPESANPLFQYMVTVAKQQHQDVQTGEFGADMEVGLINDGPVTFMLEI